MRKFLLPALCIIIIAASVVSMAAGGSASDPLVTLSYLDQIYMKRMDEYLAEKSEEMKAESLQKYQDSLDEAVADALASSKVEQEIVSSILAAIDLEKDAPASYQYTNAVKGDIITGSPGAGFILVSGAGEIYGGGSSAVLNVTVGEMRYPGAAIRDGIYYMVTASDGSGLKITSNEATLILIDGAHIKGTYTPPVVTGGDKYTEYADILKGLGLFMGTNNGYELNRVPTRQEALIMLIRLLGEEEEALKHSPETVFSDVTGWEDGRRYISYGYDMRYTSGVSATKFDQYGIASEYVYITFVLRALGYSDAKGDFVWNTTSADLAVELGLLTKAQLNDIKERGFLRDHVALISYNALSVKIKGTNVTLGRMLVNMGVITRAQLNAALTK